MFLLHLISQITLYSCRFLYPRTVGKKIEVLELRVTYMQVAEFIASCEESDFVTELPL